MPIPDAQKLVVEVTHKGVIAAGGGSTRNTANVYHFYRNTVGAAQNNITVANAFIANMVGPITDALNVDFATTEVTCRCVNDATDFPQSVANATAGQVAGDRLPDFACVSLLLRSGLRGANYRGSKHLGPFSESDIGDDILNAGALVNVTAIKTALLLGMVDAGANTWLLCVLSRTLSQLSVNPTTVITSLVSDILINKNLGTLKRRKIPTVR